MKYNSEYYKLNKEKMDKNTLEWNIKNHKRRLEICKKYRDSHKLQSKVYYQKVKNRPERIKQVKDAHERFNTNHPDYYKNWRKANPEKKLKSDIKALNKLLQFYPELKDSWDMAYALSHWAETVKKQDNYTCKNCNSRSRLHAHHIIPKFINPKLALDIENGVTYCKDCHEAYHWIFGV